MQLISILFVRSLCHFSMKEEIDLRNTLIPWVGKAGKMIGIFLGHRLQDADFDLTSKQWLMLRILSLEDGRPQQDLAVITDRNKTSLVRLIDTMERKYLVKRIQDQNDRRINRIYLTVHGAQLYQSTLPTIKEAFAVMQKGLDKVDILKVIQVLEKVLYNIKQNESTNVAN